MNSLDIMHGCGNCLTPVIRRQLSSNLGNCSAIKKFLWQLWRHAQSLHGLLVQNWRCQCKHIHRVHLLLHHQRNIKQIEFNFRFLFSSSLGAGSVSWDWKELNALRIDHNASCEEVSLYLQSQYRRHLSRIRFQNPRCTIRVFRRYPLALKSVGRMQYLSLR